MAINIGTTAFMSENIPLLPENCFNGTVMFISFVGTGHFLLEINMTIPCVILHKCKGVSIFAHDCIYTYVCVCV